LREPGVQLAKRDTSPPAIAQTQPIALSEGTPIFAQYKRRRFEAILLPNRQVVWDREEYSSPSAAASALTGGTSVNGWRFWRYIDEQGREHVLHDLRK
jgi:hypothetical protein